MKNIECLVDRKIVSKVVYKYLYSNNIRSPTNIPLNQYKNKNKKIILFYRKT